MAEKINLKNLSDKELLEMDEQVEPNLEEQLSQEKSLLSKDKKNLQELEDEKSDLLKRQKVVDKDGQLRNETPEEKNARTRKEIQEKQKPLWEKVEARRKALIETLKNSGKTKEEAWAMATEEVEKLPEYKEAQRLEGQKPKRERVQGTSEVLENISSYEKAEEAKKQKYLEAYQKEVQEKGFWGRNWSRLKDYLGIKHKDNEINERLGKIAVDYETSKLKQEFVRARLKEREERMRKEGKTEKEIAEFMQKVRERYSRVVVKVDQLEKNYKELAAVKREIWGYPKNELLKNIQEGAKKLWETKAIKNSIGNKWVRFALGGAIGAFFTGGVSWALLINRSSRFLGGMVGGKITQKILTKYRNEEKMYQKQLEDLEKEYKAKDSRGNYVNQGEEYRAKYTEKRNKIEEKLTATRRINQGLVALGAYGAGMATGALEDKFIGSRHWGGHGVDNGEDSGEENNTDNGEPIKNGTDSINSPEGEDIIRKGEGIEHALRRQIEGDPDLARSLGYSGDPTDHDALHKFSGGAAHRVAIDEGYVDPKTGMERWVYGEDKHQIAYDLVKENDGSITVHEYVDGVEKDISDSINDRFEKDIDRGSDGSIYEKTHGGYDPVKSQGGLSHTHINEDGRIIPEYEDGGREKIPIEYTNNTSTPPTETGSELNGTQGEIEKAPTEIPGQKSNYDYVQRPGLFGNETIDDINNSNGSIEHRTGVDTRYDPGTPRGVYGHTHGQSEGILEALFKIFTGGK